MCTRAFPRHTESKATPLRYTAGARLPAARAALDRVFFNPKRYDLGRVGRYKINQRLGLDVPRSTTVLTKDDFVLRLDHEIVPIVSLDMACPEEPVEEPPAVEPEETATDWLAPDRERRIVFAVDYRHLEQTLAPSQYTREIFPLPLFLAGVFFRRSSYHNRLYNVLVSFPFEKTFVPYSIFFYI